MRVGTVLPIAGDPDHDEAAVDGAQGVVAQAPFFHRAGPEVLEQEVGLRRQLLEDFLSFRLAQIERDALLVARHEGPPKGGFLFAMASPDAQRVALVRRLDLDDVGAHIAEDLAAKRPGQQRAELEHTQVCQRAVRELNRSGHRHLQLPEGA